MHAFTSSCGRTSRRAAASEMALRVPPHRGPLLVCLAAFSSLVSLPAAARPAILEETARLTSPLADYRFEDVAIDGDDLLAVAFSRTYYGGGPPRACRETVPDETPSSILLFHYRRQSDASWQLQGQIASGTADDYSSVFWRLALSNGVGAFVTGRSDLSILERASAGLTVTPFATRSDVSDIVVRDGTIAIGQGNDITVRLLRKNAAGAWVVTATVESPTGFPDDEFLGPDIEFVADELTAGNQNQDFLPEMFVLIASMTRGSGLRSCSGPSTQTSPAQSSSTTRSH